MPCETQKNAQAKILVNKPYSVELVLGTLKHKNCFSMGVWDYKVREL